MARLSGHRGEAFSAARTRIHKRLLSLHAHGHGACSDKARLTIQALMDAAAEPRTRLWTLQLDLCKHTVGVDLLDCYRSGSIDRYGLGASDIKSKISKSRRSHAVPRGPFDAPGPGAFNQLIRALNG